MTDFEILKGTKDSSFREQIKINKILQTIRTNFEKYGFRPLETPSIEYMNTLTYKYKEDDEIVQEIFKVKGRGERDLGLRYDLTVPLCRYIASHSKQIKFPFKRYAIGNVFRDGPVKSGRLREFIQCDADIIGAKDICAEAEILKMFYDTYREIGIDAIIELNNNKILRGALLQEGFKEGELQGLILSIDKLKKIREKGVLDEIRQRNLDENKVKSAISTLSLKTFEELDKKASNNELREGISELKELIKYLDNLKVRYRLNFSMSRGLAIYTGNIWEAYDTKKRIESSIGSGGRYDKIIGDYIQDGREYLAFGVSFGLVPILKCIKSEDDRISNTEVLVVPLNSDEKLINTALNLAQNLRKEGKNIEICYDFKLKKAFDYADHIGAKELAIIGRKDLEKGVYTLKNLDMGKEEKVKL